LKILFYGRLADSFGPELELASASACTVTELRATLTARYPEAEGTLRSERTRAFVEDSLVADDHLVNAEQTVAFLPPVSGG
jgi:molybdopterin converting factor small subunit